jgi:hypothetical protein
MNVAYLLMVLVLSTVAAPGEVKAGGPGPGASPGTSQVGHAVHGPAPKLGGPPSASGKTRGPGPGGGKGSSSISGTGIRARH